MDRREGQSGKFLPFYTLFPFLKLVHRTIDEQQLTEQEKLYLFVNITVELRALCSRAWEGYFFFSIHIG